MQNEVSYSHEEFCANEIVYFLEKKYSKSDIYVILKLDVLGRSGCIPPKDLFTLIFKKIPSPYSKIIKLSEIVDIINTVSHFNIDFVKVEFCSNSKEETIIPSSEICFYIDINSWLNIFDTIVEVIKYNNKVFDIEDYGVISVSFNLDL